MIDHQSLPWPPLLLVLSPHPPHLLVVFLVPFNSVAFALALVFGCLFECHVLLDWLCPVLCRYIVLRLRAWMMVANALGENSSPSDKSVHCLWPCLLVTLVDIRRAFWWCAECAWLHPSKAMMNLKQGFCMCSALKQECLLCLGPSHTFLCRIRKIDQILLTLSALTTGLHFYLHLWVLLATGLRDCCVKFVQTWSCRYLASISWWNAITSPNCCPV